MFVLNVAKPVDRLNVHSLFQSVPHSVPWLSNAKSMSMTPLPVVGSTITDPNPVAPTRVARPVVLFRVYRLLSQATV